MSTIADTSHPTPTADLLHIERWNDPLAVAQFDADTDEALMFLTPTLGPRARCYFTGSPARSTAVAHAAGRLPIWLRRSASRSARSSGPSTGSSGSDTRRDGFTLAVRTTVPPLSRRHVKRLPAYLAATYSQTESER